LRDGFLQNRDHCSGVQNGLWKINTLELTDTPIELVQ
jgi:hypothetical protein